MSSTSTSFRAHVVPTLRLALPVMLSRAGALVLVIVDTAMTGRAGAVELAYYGLASSSQLPLMLIGIGLLLGVMVLTAQADGAGRSERCGTIWKVGLMHGGVYGVILGGLCLLGEPFLLATGQSPDLASGGARVLIWFGVGMPGMLLFITTICFLEGIHRPVPGMVVMIGANVVNAGLNWVWIYGHLGFPAMGAEGAAAATAVARWFTFLAILGYVLVCVDRARYGLDLRLEAVGALSRRLRRFGYPMAIGHGLEAAAFSVLTLFAGLLGAAHVASYTIAMNLIALVFMFALGFSTAASVRIANAAGRGSGDDVRAAGWAAVLLGAAVLCAIGVGLALGAEQIVALFATEPEVLTLGVATLLVASAALVPDGLQAVLVGALRGLADVWPVTLILGFSFWLVMVPLAWVLAVREGGGGPALMASILLATVVAASVLALRFRHISRAPMPSTTAA